MNDSRGVFETTPHIRRIRSALRPTRSPLINLAILLGMIALVAFLAYQFLFVAPAIRSNVVDLTQSLERIEELSTLRSHFRFAVVVREESGNIIVRRLADQAEHIGMDNVGMMLFQDPTMIAELHGVATYGVKLRNVASAITQNDSTVMIPLPKAEVIDVKLVSADTRIVAQMKGLFRSSDHELLLEASKRGESFVREYAEADSTLLAVAGDRARDLFSLIVERSGKKAVFTE
jgi:hypothetical protein